MPINWNKFDEAVRRTAEQTSPNEAERTNVEQLVWRLLASPETWNREEWGTAWRAEPGQTALIEIRHDVPHRFQRQAQESGIDRIGIRIYSNDAQSRHQFETILPFHNQYARRLPGLPNPNVQQTLCASLEGDGGQARGGIVEQFVGGRSLEGLIDPRSRMGAIPREVVCDILERMICKVVIPLWQSGTVGFDVAGRNWRYDLATSHLTLMNLDSIVGDALLFWSRPTESRTFGVGKNDRTSTSIPPLESSDN